MCEPAASLLVLVLHNVASGQLRPSRKYDSSSIVTSRVRQSGVGVRWSWWKKCWSSVVSLRTVLIPAVSLLTPREPSEPVCELRFPLVAILNSL